MAERAAGEVPRVVWTVGHSTRSLEDFVALLTAHGVQVLVDVRRFPGSRKYPHFNQGELARGLADAGLDYVHLPELGGRREPRPDSPNVAWRNRSFQGYADYMATPEFQAGLERVWQLAAARPAALMCAEAVWWRCHRALIADELKSRGVEVRHIMDAGKFEVHPYTSAARLLDGRLSYGAGVPARAQRDADDEAGFTGRLV